MKKKFRLLLTETTLDDNFNEVGYKRIDNMIINPNEGSRDIDTQIVEKMCQNTATFYKERIDEIEFKKNEKDKLTELYEKYCAECEENYVFKSLCNTYKKALDLSCDELDNAKDMLIAAEKPDWANSLESSADYFEQRARSSF